jgi:gliding motility-associated-like protein
MNKAAYVFTACLFAVSGALAQVPKLDYGFNFAPGVTSVAADNSGNAYVTGNFTDELVIGTITLNSNGAGDIYVIKFGPTGTPVWGKSFGGADDEGVNDIEVDGSGNVYIVGSYSETVDFDPGSGVLDLTAIDQTDGYILKLDTNGALVWAGSVGGNSSDYATGVAIDASGNVFITGSFVAQIDIDPTSGVSLLTEASGGDSGEAFFAKLNPGGSLNWASMTDGDQVVSGAQATLDTNGTPIFAGTFYGTVDVDPGAGVRNLTAHDPVGSIFLVKLDDETGDLIWGNNFGGEEDFNKVYGIATDAQDRVYVTGTFGGTADFDPTSDDAFLTSVGLSDIFVARFASFGNLDWAYRFGSTNYDEALSVAVDNSDNVYLTGSFYETIDFDPKAGVVNKTSRSDADVFILKLDGSANYQWVGTLGDTDDDEGYSIATDDSGHVYTVGFVTEQADLDPGSCILDTDPGSSFAYILKFGTSLPDCVSIESQPQSVITCRGQPATFTVAALGLNLTYQWMILDDEGLPAGPLTEGAVFSGTQTATLTLNTSGISKGTILGFLVTVTGDGHPSVNSESVVLEVSADPKAQSTTQCGPGSVTIKATGGNEGEYQWYTTASGSSAIDGQMGSSYTTPLISATTTYYVSKVLADCETTRTPVVATISTDCEPAPAFVWAEAFAANGWVNDTFVDRNNGDVYTTGFFTGTSDFDPGAGLANLSAAGSTDVFVAVYETDGNLRWAKRVGGTSQDDCNAITVDASGNVLIAGYFLQTADFDPGPGVYNLTSAGSWDTFILKLDVDGNFVWAKRIGGTPTLGDLASTIKTDAAGNVYVGGSFTGTVDFDPDATNSFNVTATGNIDGHILKLDPDGNFISVAVLAGPGFENVADLELDATGNIYATGFFYNNTDFDPTTGTAIQPGSNDRNAFLWKLDSSNNLQWYKVFSAPTDNQDGYSINLDANGNVIVGGVFEGTIDFDPGPGTVQLTATDQDAFAVKFDDAGTFAWAHTIPGSSGGYGSTMVNGTDVYIYGSFFGTVDFNPGAGLFEMTSAGLSDNYIVKLNEDGDFGWAVQTGGVSSDATTDVGFDDDGNLYASGSIQQHGDYDPGVDEYDLAATGPYSGFLLKLGEASPTLFIVEQPVSQNACVGGTTVFTVSAISSGGTVYKWQKFDTSLGFFTYLADGGGYDGVHTSDLSVNTTGNFGEGIYRCVILAAGDIDATSGEATLTIVTSLPPPPVTDGSSCGSGPITLKASGSSNGNYRWFTAATGGSIGGEVNNTYITPAITTTTTYYVSIVSGPCESPRTPVQAAVTPLPTAPVVASVASCSNTTVTLTAPVSDGETFWYEDPTGGSPIQTGSTFVTPLLTSSITYHVAYFENECESPRTAVAIAVSSCAGNQPPAIAASSASTTIGGTVSIDLGPLLSDPDNNIDPASLKIVVQPTSGAVASIDKNGNLLIDYSSISFVGDDELTIEVCDIAASCVQRVINIHVDGDMVVYNALSPNGDGKNEVFILAHIDVIEATKNNRVSIFNRWGDLVFDVDNYNNTTNVFVGKSNAGKELPSGTYFYRIEFGSGRKNESGYLSLKR